MGRRLCISKQPLTLLQLPTSKTEKKRKMQIRLPPHYLKRSNQTLFSLEPWGVVVRCLCTAESIFAGQAYCNLSSVLDGPRESDFLLFVEEARLHASQDPSHDGDRATKTTLLWWNQHSHNGGNERKNVRQAEVDHVGTTLPVEAWQPGWARSRQTLK